MKVIVKKGLALISKIPTPITPINIDQSTRHITLAYFDKQKYGRLHWNGAGFLYALMPRNVQLLNISYDEYSRASG